ncbi:ATP-binding protein [Hoeflea ulvae]|uniref:C4-dicarboxylate transport sensor protein n=1 Tax=Hoeflea ulvae TaxID=2983764 RepID=A0ABT3YID6_9HYPH|nr:ATP-binding protein [Hoeflea ulvae]MCY0095668.1 ATP-binding protein [Hoeflea ulvae]
MSTIPDFPMVRPSPLLTAIMIVAAIAAAAAAWMVAYRLAAVEIEAGLEQSLIVTRRAVESEIERFRTLPRVVGEDARILALIENPADEASIASANAYLERVANHSGVAEIYVIDASGLTLSASNYREEGSFVGNNYGFRPYFADAIADGEGRYYAIGVTTGRPGYFLSSRLDVPGGRGVVVAKVDLEPLEQAWRDADALTAIADRYGVVFLSGNPDWRYRPLTVLDAATLARLDAERTYDGIGIDEKTPILNAEGLASGEGGEAGLGAGLDERLITRFRSIEPDGWLILSAATAAPARSAAGFWVLVAGVLGLLATGIVRALEQRRNFARLKARQTETLERMVAERTFELARENENRRRAETELRAAQEGLIHSAKMAALGRMSSAIVHEVSQPLAALETTLASAQALAQKEDAPQAGDRMTAARGLVRRMQRTIKHLKSFGRKDGAVLEKVNVDEAIRNALDVTQPRAATAGIAPVFKATGEAPKVLAVAVKFEQVLINLVINALDAVDGRSDGLVKVSRGQADGMVSVRVQDNGGGIAPDHLSRIKEPFFTTKLTGEGLGLGLSISIAIMQEFGGDIVFSAGPGGGTIACITLPVAGDSDTDTGPIA